MRDAAVHDLVPFAFVDLEVQIGVAVDDGLNLVVQRVLAVE